MQTHSVTADNSGINSHFSDVSGPSLCSSVPPFITVSSGIFSSTSQSQGISTNSATNTLDVNSTCISATPSLVLPKDWLGLSSQLFLTQLSAPGLTISVCLSPVSNYIVIAKDLFVDFVVLRPCNLIFLPPVEPVGAQLQKLVKCDKNSDLQPIRSLLDWSEAWSVYSTVMSNVRREKLGDLLSYFFLIAKMSRDTNQLGSGWSDNDRLFRKKAAGNPHVSWGEYDVLLNVGHVLNRRYNGSNGSSVSFPTGNRVCILWNKASGDLPSCKFRHICVALLSVVMA